MSLDRTFYALLVWAALAGAHIQTGYAPRYSAGVMERVARNRDLPIAACMISSPIYPLGTRLWVYSGNTGNLELCFVMDVSAPADRERHIRTRRIIELGYAEARRMCGLAHMDDPPTSCPVTVIKL